MTSDLSTQVSTVVLRSTGNVESNGIVAPVKNVQKTGAIDNTTNAREKDSTNLRGDTAQNVSKNEVNEAISEIKAQLESIGREINFSHDEDLDIVIIKVVNKDTEEVVRQIPSEEMVEIARHIQENKGLLFQEEV